MKKTINIFLIIFSLVLFQNCDEEQFEPSLNYVAFASDISTGVDVGGTQDVTVVVYTAENVGSDTTFTIMVDESTDAAAGSYVVPTSVTVPAGSNAGSFTVTLSDVNLGIGINRLVIDFDDVGMSGTGQPITIEYIQNCNEVTGTLDLRFNYPCEVSWAIEDAEGGVVLSGSGYSGCTSAYSEVSEPITLCAGRTYTLITTDDYGDGWGSTGSYTLTIGGVEKVTGDTSLMNNGGNGEISASASFNTN